MVRTCSSGRSRTGRVIMPAWQNRQPRVQPRKISTFKPVVHDLDERDELLLRVRPFREVGDGALVDDRGHIGEARA